MKISKNNFRRFALAFASLLCVTFMTSANATNVYNNFPVSIRYIGATQNAPIFELAFTNEVVQEFEIIITDKFNTIYKENIKGKGLVRKFQFINEEASANFKDELTMLDVEIRNLTTNNVITYKINPSTRAQNEIELVAVN